MSLIALMAFTMARAGHHAGGPTMALSAVGVAMLLCVPLFASLARGAGGRR